MRIFDGPAATGRGGRIGGWNWVVIAFLWVLLGPAVLLRAQGVRYDNIVLGPRGGPVAGATIAVCSAGASTTSTPCSPLATIYSDEGLTQPLANPFPADSLGNYGFWAAPGHYIVQIYGPGLTTRTMNVFLPCDPTNCSMSNVTFSSISAGTLNLTGGLTVKGRPVSIEPMNSDAVLYVSPNGSDSNDGLSWGTAKQTLYAAVESVENPSVGGGTIYVAAGTACGGPVSGQGLWLYRNTTSPGSGWLAATYPLNVVGVGTTHAAANAPSPTVALACGSSTQIALNLDGINTALRFANLSFTGSIALNVVSSSTVTFDNDDFAADNTVSTNGPGVMIGAASFWLYFRHCVFTSNSNAPKTGTDASEAFVENPGSGSQSGLIYILQSIANGGGDIKVEPSTGNIEEGIYVNGLTTENQNDGKGAVWITNASAYSTNSVSNVTVSDATVTTAAVEVDEGSPDATTAWNDAGQTINYSGPMTILSGYPRNTGNLTTNPNEQGEVGFLGGEVYGQIAAARRTFAPTASPWTNQVSQIPANWKVQTNGTVTRNNSAEGPDGSSFAMTIGQTGGSYNPNVYFTENNFTYAAGDYVIAGAWYNTASGSLTGGYPFNLQVLGSCVTTPIYGMNGVSITGTTPTLPGEWKWAAAALKVTTGGTCQTNFGGQFNSTSGSTMSYFAPVLFHVAAGSMTDGEAAELAANLMPYPDSLGASVEATLRGHPFAFGGSGDSYFATLDHTALTANRTYLFPDVNGSVCLATTCGGQVGQISISASTSGSHSFATGYASTPVCVASPTSNPGSTTWWVTATKTAVTIDVSASTTLSFSYACFGNPN